MSFSLEHITSESIVVANIADPSSYILVFPFLYLLCGKDLLYNNGGEKKRKSRHRDRGF
jgi:hypothetical protein